MRKVGIITSHKEKSLECAREFCRADGVYFFDIEKENILPDAIACFGGDGTFLKAAAYSLEFGVPLFSVNVGGVGFLTEYEPSEKDVFINNLLSNNALIEPLPVFSAVHGNNHLNFFNDLVVQRAVGEQAYGGAIRFAIYVDGTLAVEYMADGIIVATPAGSTAYSYSAGGAVLSPDLNAIIITPICPHLSSGAIVLPANSYIEIEVKDARSAVIYSDGDYCKSILGKDRIAVTAGSGRALIVKHKSFYKKLNDKILRTGKIDVKS